MSIAPAPYLRLTSFVGSSPYRDAALGVAMDEEFDAIQVAIGAIENRLALIQRDDGNLLNGSVGPDQLGGGLTAAKDLNSVLTLGVNTNNVLPNVLTAKGASALFSNAPAGTDFRLLISKAAVGNNASLIFQNAFSGRAEIGLSGDDNLHFRVSADGVSFVDALGISTSGIVTASTPPSTDNSTRLSTTAFVATSFAPKLNPTFTGTLTAVDMLISGMISGVGVTSLFANPLPIGSATPGTGSFTTLAASGLVNGAGFTALLAAPPSIGMTTPNAGKFTTLNTTGNFSTLGGAMIGDSSTDLIGFYGATNVARRAAGNNAVVPAGGVGTAAGGWDTAANRNIAIATINEIRATLVGVGLMPAT